MLSDTTTDARKVYFAALAAMTPAQRVARAMELTAAADELLRAAVRRRFPHIEGEDLTRELLRARYGSAIARQVCRR